MSKSLTIAFVSSEAVPFSKTGGLADVAAGLPQALANENHRLILFLPFYRQTKETKYDFTNTGKHLFVSLSNKSFAFQLYTIRVGGVSIYFIRQDEFFDRDYLYASPLSEYPDNALRFAFFSKAVLESLNSLKITPDLIHCNEWQTGLLPFYVKDGNYLSGNTKTLFTMHNIMYQGNFPKETLFELGIDEKFFTPEHLEFYGKLSFIKSGIVYSDALNTVSKTYAAEILTKKSSYGLDGVLKARKGDLYGILNGVDYSQWSPLTDKLIAAQYDSAAIGKKEECRKDILRRAGFDDSLEGPLFGNIGRLVPNKGIDNIIKAIPFIEKCGGKLILLGFGDEYYNNLLKSLASQHSRHMHVTIGFDNAHAHAITAGCDIFLMPSHYEPCGLNQLYSLKYGTIPVVGAVGGLEDTIIDYTDSPRKGNGFKFTKLTQSGFEDALKRVVSLYHDKKRWSILVARAMQCDFSWKQSAKEYITLYRRIIDR